MATFSFELVSPERLLFAGDVESVVVPGTEGEFTVLKDHAPLMSTLKPGVVTIVEAGAKQSQLFVRGGFADVNPAGLTILAETAVPLTELNASTLDAEVKAAETEVADATSDEGRRLAHEKLDQVRELRAAMSL
ncbi:MULTISPECIES: F0F1 ATP synthase subunit epsilon [Lichenihabitans]|uniref:F0F1 ATP synthase subunit epsilon n=1 Tax=Lichenihabitans TaxID=2723776 RepID=UPI0010369EA0|nr:MULTISPECIES: F0F1 ATP synthase subunit epsilon [Lichenihabitans]UDL94783.1 F0F1 ATP synthase subunit epsilon [Lichenihabitans sp. PAMC28606]